MAEIYHDVPSTPVWNSPNELAANGRTKNFKDRPANGTAPGSNASRRKTQSLDSKRKKHGLRMRTRG